MLRFLVKAALIGATLGIELGGRIDLSDMEASDEKAVSGKECVRIISLQGTIARLKTGDGLDATSAEVCWFDNSFAST